MKKHLVFVYGSLRKGFSNHGRLNWHGQQATFIGEDTIRGKLFTSNGAWPFITRSQSNNDRVVGEIYEVSLKHIWHGLDHLEGYDHRTKTRINSLNGYLFFRRRATTKKGLKVSVYLGGQHLQSTIFSHAQQHIKSGNWKDYKHDNIS